VILILMAHLTIEIQVIEEDLDPSKLFYIGHSAHNSYDVQAHNLGCGYILSMGEHNH